VTALQTGVPVRPSQARIVSRWLEIVSTRIREGIDASSMPAFCSTWSMAANAWFRMSSGFCSTQPGRG
jgi:hypothetical protein